MEDRFKFRVFISDKKNSKNSLTGMFKVHSLHTGTNKAIITSLYGNCSIKLENNILMQCTGLKDKNGNLIYEGDILKLAEFVKPVEVKHRALGFVLRREPSNTVGYDNDKYIPEDCEVIGNVYENPELLEDK